MVSKIILSQLGNNKFLAMTGAKNLLSHKDGLSFRLPSKFANRGINYVKITLTQFDLYNIEYGKVWGLNYKVIDTTINLYCDKLQSNFTRVTGLDTHL